MDINNLIGSGDVFSHCVHAVGQRVEISVYTIHQAVSIILNYFVCHVPIAVYRRVNSWLIFSITNSLCQSIDSSPPFRRQ